MNIRFRPDYRVAWLVMFLLFAARMVVAGGLPGWTEQGMRETDEAVYFTGMATDEDLEQAEQAAIDHASAQALAFIGERAAARHRMERTEEGLRSQRVYESRSEEVLLGEKQVAKRHLRQMDDGRYEVFVQVRFPRHVLARARAAQEKERRANRSDLETALGRARLAWSHGRAANAFSQLGQARAAARRIGDNSALSRVERLAGSFAADLLVSVVSGDGQRVPVGMQPIEPVIVRLGVTSQGGRAFSGIPLRMRWNAGEWQPVGISGSNGELNITSFLRPERVGLAHIEIDVDWSALEAAGTQGVASLARLTLEAVHVPRAQRVALRIEEFQGGQPVAHGFLEDAVIRALVEAGFPVIGEPVNFTAMDRTLSAWVNSGLFAISNKLAQRPDIVVEGSLQADPRGNNDGWVVSTQARGVLRVLDAQTGTTLLQIQRESPVFFGETEEASAREGRRALATRLARDLAQALVERLEEE